MKATINCKVGTLLRDKDNISILDQNQEMKGAAHVRQPLPLNHSKSFVLLTNKGFQSNLI